MSEQGHHPPVVEEITPSDSELSEEWTRVTNERDVLGVGALRRKGDDKWPWRVVVSVAEFIREEPLQSLVFTAITEALNELPGVAEAVHEDREVWVVRGAVGGEALVRAASAAVDVLAEHTREIVRGR